MYREGLSSKKRAASGVRYYRYSGLRKFKVIMQSQIERKLEKSHEHWGYVGLIADTDMVLVTPQPQY